MKPHRKKRKGLLKWILDKRKFSDNIEGKLLILSSTVARLLKGSRKLGRIYIFKSEHISTQFLVLVNKMDISSIFNHLNYFDIHPSPSFLQC